MNPARGGYRPPITPGGGYRHGLAPKLLSVSLASGQPPTASNVARQQADGAPAASSGLRGGAEAAMIPQPTRYSRVFLSSAVIVVGWGKAAMVFARSYGTHPVAKVGKLQGGVNALPELSVIAHPARPDFKPHVAL